MYKEGDYIKGVGLIETNHFGFPWVAGMSGMYYGVVQARNDVGTSYMCDAISGKILEKEEWEARLNDKSFDYENKKSNRKEWSKVNQPFGPYYYKYNSNFFSAFCYRINFYINSIIENINFGGRK